MQGHKVSKSEDKFAKVFLYLLLNYTTSVLYMHSSVIYVVDREFLYKDRYAAVGDSVTIPCHASHSQPVMWQYKNAAEMNADNVYDGDFIGSYVNKCTISRSTYDLTILDVEVDDAGEYWCIEDEGFGAKHVTKLFVTGMHMFHCCYMVVKFVYMKRL